MEKILFSFTFFTLSLIPLQAQDLLDASPDRNLEGYWTGSFIRSGNSAQQLTAEITSSGDSMVIAMGIPDWVYYPGRVFKLTREGNKISFETVYGEANLTLDTSFMEMSGTVSDASPPWNLHLKRSLRPPSTQIATKDFSFVNEDAKIGGTLYYPENLKGPLACAIIVHGRGCPPRNWKRSRAKLLAEYGLASFVYDKRGSEPTDFPCDESTHELNVSDVAMIVSKLAKDPLIDDEKIGLISYSAGGWIVPHVARVSKPDIAFIVTVVGPTTSVLEQQVDGLVAYLGEAGYDQKHIDEATQYTELLFTKSDYESAYNRMQELLISAKSSGWDEWLVDDDYASSPEAIKDVWVQRFSYDPRDDLATFEGPFLAIFGEKDPIVPYKKQVERLNQIIKENGNDNFTVKIVPEAGHGMEHGHRVRQLRDNQYYFKYDRVAYGAFQYIIDFLQENKFIEK